MGVGIKEGVRAGQSALLHGTELSLRWGCHSMSSCDGVSPIVLEPVQIIPKGSPVPHAKAPANPLNIGHHPENWSDVSMFWYPVPCIRSHKSAGQSFVNFVMGLMVGDRRFPGATILGARFSTSSANHPVSVPPTGRATEAPVP